jgi:hypothetical protein
MPAYDPFGSGPGAAGIGVGAVVQRARSRREMQSDGVPGIAAYDMGPATAPGFGEHASQYPGFVPPQTQHALYDSTPLPTAAGHYAGPGIPAPDLLDAAGLGVVRGPSLHMQRTGHQDLSRSKSQGARSLGTDGFYGPGNSMQDRVQGESYAAHYQPGYQHQSPPLQGDIPGEDAYGGYVGPSPVVESHSNTHSPGMPVSQDESGSDYSDGEQDAEGNGGSSRVVSGEGSKTSLRDEEDYELERGKRVLKVIFSFIRRKALLTRIWRQVANE